VKKLIRKIFHSGEFDYSFDLIQNHKKFTFASDVAKAVLLFFLLFAASQPLRMLLTFSVLALLVRHILPIC